MTSTNETRATEARAWSLILDDVPVDAIVPGTQTAIKNKPNSYKPGARDVLAACRGEEWQTGADGKTERVVCANGPAYETWDEIKARAETMASHALPEPLPPLEVEIDELKRRLGLYDRAKGEEPMPATEKPTDPDVVNYGALVVDMARPTGIDLDACTPQQIADLRAFGQWWLYHHPREVITKDKFGSAWHKFERERAAKRARRQAREAPSAGGANQ